MPENLEKSAVAAGLEKVSFSFEVQRRTMQKNVQNITQLPLFHTLRCVVGFSHDILHVSMPFLQIIPPSASPIESKSLFDTSVSLLLGSHTGLLLPSF